MEKNKNLDIFKNLSILITGGTGTFGNAVLQRFLKQGIREVRIFSRDEKKQDEMRNLLCNPIVKFYIGNVRDYYTILPAMKGVDLVFHAAALKQVPSCEFFPVEALRTNALGADNVIRAAQECEVKSCILLSTDKAVNPINAMGMSKALMEKIMIARARAYGESPTIFCGTRYGNVMGSRGSVIPLFVNQILSGLPITVTDPRMTRFMMSADGAIELVIYAFLNGRSGDIFVQKSPAITIDALAKALIRIFNAKNDIKVIGTRHGEKMFETLLNREEMTRAEDLGDYYRIPVDLRDLNYSYYFNKGTPKISVQEEYNSHNTKRLSVDEMEKILLDLDFIKEAVKTKRISI